MTLKRLTRKTGTMVFGVSLSLILGVAGQDSDPFADGRGSPEDADPFSDGGGGHDPFADTYHPRIFRKGKAGEALKNQKDQVSVMIEMIEVDHLTANEMMLRFSKNANNVEPMRKELIDLVKNGEAKLKETLWGRSSLNEVSKAEAMVGKIYPTEYEPPRLPQLVVGAVGEKEESGSAQAALEVKGAIYTGATPSAFDTRNVGTLLEFEAAKSAEQPGKIGLSIHLQVVQFLQEDQFLVEGFEEDARGTANIIMPRFSTVSLESLVTVTPGSPTLLGIFKDGADKTESKRVIILMHVEMIANE